MKKIIALIALFGVMITTGCVHTATSTAGQATPYQQVVTYDAALAESNKAVANSVIVLNTSGVLTTSQAAEVLAVQKKIAQVNLQLGAILAQGPAVAQANSATIFALLNQITGSVTTLQQSGVIPVNANTTQIQTELQSLISIAQIVVTQLNIAGVK